MIGPSVLHGPHHSAQRSTTTGTVIERSITAVPNVASVTSVTTDSLTAHFDDRRGRNALLASPSMNGAVVGIDEANVSAWMSEHVSAVAPLSFELIAGGRSNLTYRVVDAKGNAFALRRPPTSHVLPTAHDMVREFTVISALFPLAIPVAEPLGLCVDEEVNERPFYVMEFVDGAILRDRAQAEATFDEATRGVIGDHLAATLAQLHDVDVEGAGLSELARHDGYIERQLRRWRTQYEQMHVEGVDYGGLIDAGLGASNAIGTMLDTIYTEVLATFDTEYFIDQRARRPIARIVDGVTTELTWPEIQLRYGRDGDGADIIFLVGPEPDFHWSDFVDVVTDAAGRFDVRLVVGLGAFPAPTPHTRPVRIIGTAPEASAHLLPLVGTVHGELEVPAGISSALELGFAEVDMD